MNSTKPLPAKGFSLIELLIAMVLGTAIVSGLITIMAGIKQTSSLNTALAEIQSNGRFAMDQLNRDIRMAGYQGCLDFNTSQLTLSLTNGPTDNLQDTAVYGSVIGATNWSPAAPLNYAPPNTIVPVVGSHALVIQRADSQVHNIDASMLSDSDSISIEAPANHYYQGGLAIITNCESGDLFEINNLTEGAGTVTLFPDDALSTAYTFNSDNPKGVEVLAFSADIYFIADTGRNAQDGTDVISLYSQTWPYTAANPPREIIEGVENMLTRFGHRTDDGNLLFLAPDDTEFNPQKIVSVDIGMLLSSSENVTSQEDINTYIIAGTEISAAADTAAAPSATTHARTKKIRRAFNATIDIRNRR